MHGRVRFFKFLSPRRKERREGNDSNKKQGSQGGYELQIIDEILVKSITEKKKIPRLKRRGIRLTRCKKNFADDYMPQALAVATSPPRWQIPKVSILTPT